MDDILNDFTISYTNVPVSSCYMPSLTATWSDEEKEISLTELENSYLYSDFGYSYSIYRQYPYIGNTKDGKSVWNSYYEGIARANYNYSSFSVSSSSEYIGLIMRMAGLEYYNLLGYDNANSLLKYTNGGLYSYFPFYDIRSISVSSSPSKTSYIEGETFNSSGMVIKLTYTDGETITITDYDVDTTPLTAGQTEVYVTYKNCYTTVPITVSEKEVSSIAVTTQPTKTAYIVGQSFDDSGMVITATYTDGTTAKIDNDLLTYTYSGGSSYFTDYLDGEYITVSYAGKIDDTATFNVEEKTAVSVVVTSIPSNLNFYTNESYTSDELETRLDDDGLELTVTYNDGTSAVIANSAASFALMGGAADTVNGSIVYYVYKDGSTAVHISASYDGCSTLIPITIVENSITGIEVTEQPDKTSYTEGDSFDPSGMTVTAIYADGSEEEITDYSYSSINGTGSVSVYITYGSFYDTVTVNVEEAQVVTMTGITVSSSPTKTTYVAGENFDKSGMVIEAVYSNGSTVEIFDYNYSPTTLSESDTSVIITYGNYYTTIPVSVSAKEITKIEVTTPPTKTEYVQGEVFNASGMVVTATYSDNTTVDLASSEYSYSTEALTTLGNIDFEISAANCTATTPITVIEKEISSISVTQYPDKVSYYDGQSFDSTGMIVQATYNDGSTAVISDYTVSPTVLTSGDTEVTVSKDGFSDVVKITVSEKSLSKIAVTSQPSVISYIAGETFNSSGMTVTAYYNDDSYETITDYTITNPTMTAGTDTVYITYEGLYTTVSVTVTEKTVTGIEVSEQPSKTSYIAGEAFDISGMVINLDYSDGSYEEITNYNYSPVILNTGDTSVLITYGNYFATVPISVAAKEITGIEIETYPDKVTYVEGETFDDSGIVVLATYNDGSTSYLASNEYTYSTDPLTLLDLYVTVYAGNVSDIVPIRVVDKEITGIAVTEYPNKVSYYAGQSFDSTGMIVEAAYNDGSTAIISDYSVSPETITSGTTEVTISKDGYSDMVKISVSDVALKSIAVTTPPTKTSYYAGEPFISDGMVVTGYFNDGSSAEITDYSISNSTLTSGTMLVYITYDGLYTTTSVTVSDKTITGIEIATLPDKTSYVAGQTFDSSGMIVNAVYSDGSTAEVTGYSISPSTLSVNDTNVLVTYGNYFASVSVSVAAKEIESISIVEKPSKTEYVEGEVFDPSGMIVEATYNDGSTSYLTSSEYTYSTSALATSDNSVTIYAGDVSASVGITVVSKEITDIAVTEYPDKISYVAGQSFDSAGMIVTASYNDGSTAVITDYSVSPTTITSGTTEVTISKDGYSDTIKIFVSDVVLNSIAVTKAPTKISYVAGESFDSSGMVVMGYYNDGSSAEITDYSVSNSTLSTGTTLVYVTYDGLYATAAVTVTDKVLTGITVTSQPSKISYVAGENFSTDGLIITAEYNDGTTEEITNYSYNPVSLSTSDTSVMVTYGNYFVTIPVSVVAKEITSIEIETYPDKVTYVDGEVFDDSGMIVLATYNDGSTSYLAANEYSYSTDPLTTSDFYVTITAGSASDIVPIRVIDKTITSISVIEYPDKVSYIAGQSFDSSGMVVETTYNDGATAIITDYTVSPETITSGTTEIIISKDGYSDAASIVVSEKAIVSLDVTKQPDKSSYFAGQTFDSAGMIISITYNDGTTEEISDYSIINPVLSLDTDCVYITYGSLFTTVPVTVSEKVLTDIAVTTQPNTVSYVVGQSFNVDGMVVTGYFSDGSAEEISDYEIDTEALILGQTKVYVTYGGYYDIVNVNVVAKEVTDIEIISQPTKDSYVEGETFNPEGIVIKVTYNDGEEEIMTYDNDSISYPTDPLTTEDTSVEITVGGISAEVKISVITKKITGIQVVTAPDKIDYVVGQNFNPDGMTVLAYFNDGTSAEISDYSFTPETVSANTDEITVIKDGFIDTVKIVVSERVITNIEITTLPDKTEYTENDTFDPSGMTVTAYFNDGSAEEITDYNVDDFLLSVGMEKVYVTYENLFATVDITVNSKSIVAIEIITPPVTVEYVEGQQFDITGMMVKAYYDDGSESILETYDYEPNGSLTLEDSIITISKDGATAKQAISVIEKVVTGITITKNPDKTDYTEGDVFNPDGMEVTAEYNDGSTEVITDYTYPTDPLEEGDTYVTISHDGFTAEAEITLSVDDILSYISERNGDVNRDGSVSREDALILMRYLADTADFADYAVHTGDVDGDGQLTDKDVTLINNHISGNSTLSEAAAVEADIDGDGEVSENDLNLVRKAILNMWSLDVVYEANADANDDGEINMLDVVWILTHFKKATTIDYIYIASQPDKTSYVEGQSFDPAGMTVKAVYLDGTEEEITDYTYPLDALEIGDTSIKIEYEGFTAEVEITIVEKRIGFDTTESTSEATTENGSDESSETTTNSCSETTTKGNSGDDETTTKENGSDGSTETTTGSNFDGSTELTTETGNSDSTTEATTEYNYGNSEGVVIVNLPNKVNYVEGEIFDPAGILTMLYWNDGSTSYINEDDVYIDDTPLSVGDIYGVIYYEYKNDTEKINVPITVIEKKAVSATVITPPDKTEYDEGESFDPSGMEVEIEYNDGSTEIIPGEDVTFDDTPLTPDDDSVTVIADGVEVEVPIIVNETTTESTTEATTEDTETTTKKSSGGGGSGSSSHTTTETTTEATTETDDSDGNGDTDGTNDSDNGENADSENSDNNGNGSNSFTDVIGHLAEKYIEHLHNLGIVNGVTDSLYSPDLSTKHGDFAVVLNRLLNLEDGNVTFDDVDSNSYYSQAISNCTAADIFIGYGDSTFKPEQTISRQEMFVIMAKMFAGADYDFNAVDLTALDSFTDGSAVSEWAKPYTAYLVSIGAVVGDENELRPVDNITRAEMAVIIYNYIK
ncbi:MAG: bacterial Ig-like domain-containing protein [Clostridiales bacterium]|nr:bacterial Ig-like domain-containing protein [Clostridiales bacterium]